MAYSIETPRLKLRGLSPQDAQALLSYRCLAEVWAFQSWQPASLNDAQAFIAQYPWTGKMVLGRWQQLGLGLKSTGELIGDCGFCPSEDEQAEIGYTIAPRHQGQGYGTEAVRGLVDYLFKELGLHRIVARVDPGNVGSIKLLKKLRFRQEGYLSQSTKIRGEWKDDVLFAILKEEWPFFLPGMI